MKKSTMIALIACGAGLLLLIAGRLIFKGDNDMFFGNRDRTEKSYVCTGDIDRLVVNETCYKTTITVKDVEKAEIRYFLDEKTETVTVGEKNGELTFKRDDNKKGVYFDIDFINSAEYPTEIVLPGDFNGELIVKGISGRLEVREITGTKVVIESSSGAVKADGIKAEELVVTAVSGAIRLNDAEVSGNLSVEASSGRVEMKNVSCCDLSSTTVSGAQEIGKVEAKNVSATASSGAVKCYDMTVDKDIYLKTVSGRISLEDSSAEALKSESGSGAHMYADVKVERIKAKAVSGGIGLDRLDIGSEGVFNTSSGSVKGTVKGNESDFSVITKTSSGSSNLNNTRTGEKTLDITTTSGSIKVTFVK